MVLEHHRLQTPLSGSASPWLPGDQGEAALSSIGASILLQMLRKKINNIIYHLHHQLNLIFSFKFGEDPTVRWVGGVGGGWKVPS